MLFVLRLKGPVCLLLNMKNIQNEIGIYMGTRFWTDIQKNIKVPIVSIPKFYFANEIGEVLKNNIINRVDENLGTRRENWF